MTFFLRLRYLDPRQNQVPKNVSHSDHQRSATALGRRVPYLYLVIAGVACPIRIDNAG